MSSGSNVSDSLLAAAEQLELAFPGFRGYKERDLIRQDDALVRGVNATNLRKAQEKIRFVEQKLVEVDPFDGRISQIETLLSRLRTITEEVTSAPAGALSYYARFNFGLEEQQSLVDYDLSLYESSNRLFASINENLDAQAITDQTNEIHDQFFERNKLFLPPQPR